MFPLVKNILTDVGALVVIVDHSRSLIFHRTGSIGGLCRNESETPNNRTWCVPIWFIYLFIFYNFNNNFNNSFPSILGQQHDVRCNNSTRHYFVKTKHNFAKHSQHLQQSAN